MYSEIGQSLLEHGSRQWSDSLPISETIFDWFEEAWVVIQMEVHKVSREICFKSWLWILDFSD